MTSSRLVRGARTRTVVCVCLIMLLGALVYVFHGTQTRLSEIQKVANTCTQQAESLSAQFQVLFEYKLRLEKSLQTEKKDHKKAVEEAEKKIKEEKEAREKEKEEATNKLWAKTLEYNDLKTKYDDAEEESKKLKKQISDLTNERTLMKNAHETLKNNVEEYKKEKIDDKAKIASQDEEISKLKDQVTDLKAQGLPQGEADKLREELRKQLDQTKKELSECRAAMVAKAVTAGAGGAVDLLSPKESDNLLQQVGGALEAPAENGSDAKGSSTTTPGINPQALYTADSSSPKPSTKEALKNEESAFLTFKKSTPESRGQAAPLPVPGAAQDQQSQPENGVGQIPIPHAGFAKPQEESMMVDHDQWGSEDNKKDLNNAAIEDNDFPQQNDNRKNRVGGANYADRDYKEDAGDEDDDDGERDYGINQGQGHHVQPFNMDSPNDGVIMNPK